MAINKIVDYASLEQALKEVYKDFKIKADYKDLGRKNIDTITESGLYRIETTIPDILNSNQTYHIVNFSNPLNNIQYGFQIIFPAFDVDSMYFRKKSNGIWGKSIQVQSKTSSDLRTTEKDIVGAINELKEWLTKTCYGENERAVTNIGETKPYDGTRSGFYRITGTAIGLNADGYALIRNAHTVGSHAVSLIARFGGVDELYFSQDVQCANLYRVASREWIKREMLNHGVTIATNGRYVLQTALSSEYKFINVLIGESSTENGTQIIRIPFEHKNKTWNVYGLWSSGQVNEFCAIGFYSDTEVSYSINNLNGTNQCCIKRIWQSNV